MLDCGHQKPLAISNAEGLDRQIGINELIGTLWSPRSYVKNIAVGNFENIMELDGKGRGVRFYVRWE